MPAFAALAAGSGPRKNYGGGGGSAGALSVKIGGKRVSLLSLCKAAADK